LLMRRSMVIGTVKEPLALRLPRLVMSGVMRQLGWTGGMRTKSWAATKPWLLMEEDLGEIGLNISEVNDGRVEGDDGHRDEGLEDRLDGDAGAVLDGRGHDGPGILDDLARHEGLEVVRDAAMDENAAAVIEMAGGTRADIVIGLLELGDMEEAVGIGQAVSDDELGEVVNDGDGGIGNMGRADTVEREFVNGLDR
jgi:hypothetical protein